ncbi:Tm-1-like ATP-binding domain-containing protein [Ruicaihuangia caeni]|uniref:Tm-1-like ATP-binding domain-containing protein n=1 Tax=Ruicaihuangia caeni TaxID=3042517 RepID=A0AAW6T0N7_9MICO|nr:Tm-1-like ATP-binding domain-containing protein [Klugiella sp. YN-L-19]MDI2097385.1 Tm-1-like ATP-binding domain-containing protein [Klugiella sp. YN-L-19]
MASILVVGAFDAKREPLELLLDEIRRLGGTPVAIDTSVFAHGAPELDYDAATVASEAGYDHASLAGVGRAVAVHSMGEGAAALAERLVRTGSVGAVVCIGGSNAATVFSMLTRVVPIGIPKFLMSTVVAGNTRPMMNATDVVMLYPIVDIEGSGAVVQSMASRLASMAVAAADSNQIDLRANASSRVGLTMFGVTTPCVSAARRLVEAEGLDAFVVHANGAGGQSLERFIADSLVSTVLDISTTELADELFGGMFPAGPERLRTAAKAGVPQVVSAGAIDMINFGPLDTVPDVYRGRKLLPHNDLVTLVRTTPAENLLLGKTMGERLAPATAPTVVVVPLKGVSELDKEGGEFFDPNATAAFLTGLSKTLPRSIKVIEIDAHINDPAFAETLVAHTLEVRDAAGFKNRREAS